LAPAGSSASHNGGSATFDDAGASPVKPSNIATELELRIAVALAASIGSDGPLVATVKRVNGIHEALKDQLFAGLLTETEYAKKAGGLLNILSNFDGLIAEAANGSS
jgi:hypothetical protein